MHPPKWGAVQERTLENGSLQTVYSCEPGRKLKGHKILTCTETGWDHSVPKCIAIGKNIKLIILKLQNMFLSKIKIIPFKYTLFEI